MLQSSETDFEIKANASEDEKIFGSVTAQIISKP
jgi:ribosomal protein L9